MGKEPPRVLKFVDHAKAWKASRTHAPPPEPPRTCRVCGEDVPAELSHCPACGSHTPARKAGEAAPAARLWVNIGAVLALAGMLAWLLWIALAGLG